MTQDIGKYYPYTLNTVELVLNEDDAIYNQQGGEYALLNLVQLGSEYSAGFLGSVTIGVETNDTSPSTTTTSSGTRVSSSSSAFSTAKTSSGNTITAALATPQTASLAQINTGLVQMVGAAVLSIILGGYFAGLLR